MNKNYFKKVVERNDFDNNIKFVSSTNGFLLHYMKLNLLLTEVIKKIMAEPFVSQRNLK